MQHCGLKGNRMSNLDKLLNNYCVLQVLKNYAKLCDKDEIIFSNFEELIFFIDEIRAEEREACAVACDEHARVALSLWHKDIEANKPFWNGEEQAADRCAEAIRARGEK